LTFGVVIPWTSILRFESGFWTLRSQLFEASGRLELPTVDAVRRLSKTNMNDASAVMKEWRRLQIVG
jgi:hypothetical protein